MSGGDLLPSSRKSGRKPPRGNKLLGIAGSLAIIDAGICLSLGIPFTLLAINPLCHMPQAAYAVIGPSGLLGSAAGVGAAILIFRRRRLNLAVAGLLLMIPAGVTVSTLLPGWFFGIPIILLAALSIIFIVMSRRKFAS